MCAIVFNSFGQRFVFLTSSLRNVTFENKTWQERIDINFSRLKINNPFFQKGHKRVKKSSKEHLEEGFWQRRKSSSEKSLVKRSDSLYYTKFVDQFSLCAKDTVVEKICGIRGQRKLVYSCTDWESQSFWLCEKKSCLQG